MATNFEPGGPRGTVDVSIRRHCKGDWIGGRPRLRIHHTGPRLGGHNGAGAKSEQRL